MFDNKLLEEYLENPLVKTKFNNTIRLQLLKARCYLPANFSLTKDTVYEIKSQHNRNDYTYICFNFYYLNNQNLLNKDFLLYFQVQTEVLQEFKKAKQNTQSPQSVADIDIPEDNGWGWYLDLESPRNLKLS